jgi:dTDP-4-amino-4,6-dideoxygalactose transaminase
MAGLAISGAAPVCTSTWPAWPQWGGAEAAAVSRVLESGDWSGYSAEIGQFEERFAARHEARHCVSTSNGTVSLVVALLALGIQPGDEVIVPPYTFFATASAVRLVNAIPVFVDIDAGSWNLNLDAVEAAVGPRTRAVIPVHFAGLPVDMDRLTRIARQHDLRILEDAAHAHGSRWGGRSVGAIGDAGSFSFQANKNLTAGEGGALVSNDGALALRMWSLANHGRDRGDWYEHQRVGANHRMGAWQAALLQAQLDRMDAQLERRMRSGRLLRESLADSGLSAQTWDPRANSHAHHLLALRYNPAHFAGAPRDAFAAALRAEGIPCSLGYPRPLYQQAALTDGPSRVEPCPVAERTCQESIWLSQNLLLADDAELQAIPTAIARIHTHAAELPHARTDRKLIHHL